jgi:AcrR family transcriptional regulator
MARRTGRRPGKQDTREAILAAARTVFANQGYEGASIRQIARDAGVDPALVHHYYGTKEELFRAVVQPPVDIGEVLPKIFAGDREGIPERMLRTFMGVWENPVTGPGFLALVRGAVTNKVSGRLVREFFTHHIQRRLMRTPETGIDPAEVPLRSSLVASQMLGLALTRYVFRFEPLASASQDTVVAAVQPTLARYLWGDLTAPERDAGPRQRRLDRADPR